MALRYIDSCGDHYANTDATLKWTGAGYNSHSSAGVHGYCMKGSFGKGMNFPTNTIIMEAYIKRINIPGSLFGLVDTNNNLQISCNFNALGAFEVHQWAGEMMFQSDPDLIRVGTWHHWAWKVLVHRTAGTVECRLNGETICTLTGVSTTNGLYEDNPNPYYFSGMVGGFHMGGTENAVWFDDLVVMDDVDDGIDDARLPGGGGFDKFLGQVQIVVKRPNGVGASADWTPYPAPPNWANVDDSIGPDRDTTYNTATPDMVGASDLFHMENLLPAEDVIAVQSLNLARKTEEGVAVIAPLIHHSGATSVRDHYYLPSSYDYQITPEPLMPDGTAWNKAKWDAIQYGYRRLV